MDIFSQNKMLIRVIALLILLNLSLLVVVFYTNSHHPNHRPPPPPPFGAEGNRDELTSILETELKLSTEQVKNFKQLRNHFFIQERAVIDLLRSQRDSMNTEMFKEITDTVLVKAIAKRISANEYRMEMLRLNQAIELKKLCTPEQLGRFEALVIEIRDYFKLGPPHGGPPH